MRRPPEQCSDGLMLCRYFMSAGSMSFYGDLRCFPVAPYGEGELITRLETLLGVGNVRVCEGIPAVYLL